MNLTSVRTNHEGLCDFHLYDTFVSQSCKSLLFIYLNVSSTSLALPSWHDSAATSLFYATTPAQSMLFVKKTFQTYIFYSKENNLTEKALFLEPISTECPNCKFDIDPNLMVQLCFNYTCVPPLTNSTVKLSQSVLLTVAFGTPEYLYKYDLRDIAVFDNGVPVQTPVEEFLLGTVTALRVPVILLDKLDGKRNWSPRLHGARLSRIPRSSGK